MKILFITNIPSPYRVDFFNELGKKEKLTVLFEKEFSPERNTEWKKYHFENFNGIFLKGKSVSAGKAICFEVIKYLNEKWDHIIIADVSSPTGMLSIQYMKMKHIRYWIEGDGGYAKNGKGLKERIKKYFISGAYGYFSTSNEHDKYYLTYGADKSRIFRYPFTSISQQYIDQAQEPFDKTIIKKKLGITEEKIILAIGQFIQRKGFDVLLKATANLSSDVGVYFVGGEPTEEYINIVDGLSLNNVHFIGFKPSEQLMDFFRVADVFTLPTREDVWGLVINEAMAFSLPIITTNKCIAGLELVKDNENGYIVPVDDVVQLHNVIQILCNDEQLRRLFGKNSFNRIKSYTIENMAKAHRNILMK